MQGKGLLETEMLYKIGKNCSGIKNLVKRLEIKKILLKYCSHFRRGIIYIKNIEWLLISRKK